MKLLPYLFPFKKAKEKHFLSISIGTETIKVLAFKKNKEKNVILGRTIQYFDEYGWTGEKEFNREIIERAIFTGTKEIKRQIKINPEFIQVELPAIIAKEKVTEVSVKREKQDQKIDERERKGIRELAFGRAEEKVFEGFAQKTGILPEDFQTVERKIAGIKIDGYEVPEILGFSGSNIDFKILISAAPKYYFEEIRKIITKLKFKNWRFVNIIPGLESFATRDNLSGLFLDIGGRLTKIFLIEKGKIEMIEDIDGGGYFFSVALSQALGMSLERARILKESYGKRLLSEEVRKKINEILTPALLNWFSNLKEKLNEKNALLPSNFFLMGGGSLLPEIQEVITEGNWRDLSFIADPSLKLFLPQDLKNIEDRASALSSPQDTPLLMLCEYEQ